ncbi:MAG: peptidoglycan-binding domain-containing protein [Paracoccaceae bacterium]
MAFIKLTGFLACICLSACSNPIPVEAPQTSDMRSELIHLNSPGPPPGPDGTCWGNDVTPAVIETETEQQQATPEVRDEAGNITTPASYRTVSKQKMLHDREKVWFKTPCPAEITPDFIATLQRALKARGLYLLPLTGVMDDATQEAVRRYQASRGFDSPILTLAATRELGIVATSLSEIK